MRLFLDSSVVLAACGRATGASRAVFDMSEKQQWTLHWSSYVLSEVSANLPKLSAQAARDWPVLRATLHEVPDIVSFGWAAVVAPAEDARFSSLRRLGQICC